MISSLDHIFFRRIIFWCFQAENNHWGLNMVNMAEQFVVQFIKCAPLNSLGEIAYFAWPIVVIFSSKCRSVDEIGWHYIRHWLFFLCEGRWCGFCHVLPKKLTLSLWLCWLIETPWPSAVGEFLSTAAEPPVCSGESMFRLRMWTGRKS